MLQYFPKTGTLLISISSGEASGCWQICQYCDCYVKEECPICHRLYERVDRQVSNVGRSTLRSWNILPTVSSQDCTAWIEHLLISFSSVGQYQDAIDHNLKAIELRPHYPEAYVNLGLEYISEHFALHVMVHPLIVSQVVLTRILVKKIMRSRHFLNALRLLPIFTWVMLSLAGFMPFKERFAGTYLFWISK